MNCFQNSVSVIIPTHNSLNEIVSAVDSLVSESFYIGEVIVVFSNSSVAYVQDIKIALSNYVNHFDIAYFVDETLSSNGATARNTGIMNSRFDFLAFLDDDDFWLPGKLECYFSLVKEQSIEDRDFLLFSAVVHSNRDNSISAEIGSKYCGQHIAEYLFCDKGVIQTSTWLLPRYTAQRVLFNPELVRHQDYDFCLRAYSIGVEFLMYSRPMSHWVINQKSNFIKKGATYYFCKKWFLEYKIFMTLPAMVGYFKKDLLYVAFKERKILDFILFSVSQVGFLWTVKLLIEIVWSRCFK